jgi:sec-independent protein translocase protein TatA
LRRGEAVGSSTMFRLGLPELAIILAIIIIMFGANRLPQIGRGIGAAIKNFKAEVKTSRSDDDA